MMAKPRLTILVTTKHYNQKIVGYTEDIALKDYKSYSTLQLINTYLNTEILFESGDRIYFLFEPYSSRFLYQYTILEKTKLDFENCNTNLIKTELGTKPYYSRFYYTLIQSWFSNRKKYDWRKLNTLRKNVWINACSGWTYRLEENYTLTRPNKTIIIDGKEILSLLDLYCYLGEVIVGYTGYVGSNLGALEDVLYVDLKNKDQYTIIFKNVDQLIINLSSDNKFKYCSSKDYVEDILDIFTKAHFKQIIIE